MAAKAKLKIILKADETVVAEIDDAILWQRVLGIINNGAVSALRDDLSSDPLSSRQDDASNLLDSDDSVAKFANRLDAPVDVINGALSPSREPPYLHLNAHNWEAFKRNYPKRGPGAVSPIGLAGTALALWFKEAKIEIPATQALASDVLGTISVKDPNPSRGIKNTKWLQSRAAGSIIVNPAEISKAQEVTKAFCLKKGPGKEA